MNATMFGRGLAGVVPDFPEAAWRIHPGCGGAVCLVALAEMGEVMARELADLVANEAEGAGRRDRALRSACWYTPWTRLVNERRLSLGAPRCSTTIAPDWQGRPLLPGHPYNFRSFMEAHFYGGIDADLRVPKRQRHALAASTITVREGDRRRSH